MLRQLIPFPQEVPSQLITAPVLSGPLESPKPHSGDL